MLRSKITRLVTLFAYLAGLSLNTFAGMAHHAAMSDAAVADVEMSVHAAHSHGANGHAAHDDEQGDHGDMFDAQCCFAMVCPTIGAAILTPVQLIPPGSSSIARLGADVHSHSGLVYPPTPRPPR